VILAWTPEGWDDYLSLRAIEPEAVKKVNLLLKEISRDHFGGLGKPEPLRGNFKGWWSRRITGEHRLIYRVTGKDSEKRLEIAQCRYHYKE
jgi:toxin YoeB